MTLADERRGIAQGMAASRAATGGAERRATGQSLVDERRGIGQRLVDERRGIKDDLNALEKSPRKNAQLPQLERRGTRGPAMGVGSWNPARVPSTGGGGLVSPITEVSRTVHPDRLEWSSEGLVAFTRKPTKELIMEDAAGRLETRVFPNAP
ncbi:hypothetical protein DFO61_3362 [Ectopseudomonas oleovorans]|uniref:Uncharacterized protein n=1 Tax=Ectopseudomonas oleovorans TaxID=301 RepID=A0A397MCB8_ECTOL|nr:hypothetical protein [Pseudomonas oleovorans]RIA22672.1 hypothetical protein DFO61_3362 [Pseudomonas oleovorans]